MSETLHLHSKYDYGDHVRLSATFLDFNGDAADPDVDVILRVMAPNGAVNVYQYSLAQITRDGVGLYSYIQKVEQEGDWYYRFEGTDDPTAAAEYWFHVQDSVFF